MNARHAARLASAAALCLLTACGGHSTPSASQVAVKVNKDEISVLELNQRLARLNGAGMNDEQKLTAQKSALEGLVDQELLIEQAKAKQLDRDPAVVSAVEAAKAQILAEAYVEKQISPSARPSEADIQKYYRDNPNLFELRRIYALQEALIPQMTVEQREEVKKRLAAKNDLEEAARWMKSQDIKMTANVGVRPAEQIPMAVLDRLIRAHNGEVEFIEGPNGGADIIKVISSQLAPVDEKAAHASIDQFLTNRNRSDLIRTEIKRLRDAAKIEYVGDFQKLAMQTSAPPAAAVPAAASPDGVKAGEAVAKGIKGL